MSDKEMYQQHGSSSRVGVGERSALLIIAFIKGFADTTCPLGSNLDAEVAATKEFLTCSVLCRCSKNCNSIQKSGYFAFEYYQVDAFLC